MTDRPILFSASEVRALLAGTKTQTRRVLKRVPDGATGAERSPDHPEWRFTMGDRPPIGGFDCPYGEVGDELWVREAWAKIPATAYRMSEGVQQTVNPADAHEAAIYAAGWDRSIPKWKPSIHMPRWASRISLRITDLRVERLHDCSEADALAEGIYRVDPTPEEIASGDCTAEDFVFMATGTRQGWGITKEERAREKWAPTAVSAYRELWEAINGPKSWDANPWVWCLSFEVAR